MIARIVILVAWTALAVLVYGLAVFMTVSGDCIGIPGCADDKQRTWWLVTGAAVAVWGIGVFGIVRRGRRH